MKLDKLHPQHRGRIKRTRREIYSKQSDWRCMKMHAIHVLCVVGMSLGTPSRAKIASKNLARE